jgi:hypothetical protein
MHIQSALLWLFLTRIVSIGYFITSCAQQAALPLALASYVPSEHRIPENEGWGWSDSLVYNRSATLQAGYDFTDLHRHMKKYLSTLYTDLALDPHDKNICIARFSFIIKNKANNSRRVCHLSIDKGMQDPFENHVFISGSDTVDKGEKGSDLYLFGKKSTAEKDAEAVDDTLEKYKAEIYFNSYHYKSAKNKRYIFVHPKWEDYCTEELYQLGYIAQKICRLYEHRADPLPIIGFLARRWFQLSENSPATDFAEWYSIAGWPGPYHIHSDNTKSDADKAVFFQRHQDSEQKLLFYLNSTTDCLHEFQLLEKIIKDFIKLLCSVKGYKESLSYGWKQEIVVKELEVKKEIWELMAKGPLLTDCAEDKIGIPSKTARIENLKKVERTRRDAIGKKKTEIDVLQEKLRALGNTNTLGLSYDKIKKAFADLQEKTKLKFEADSPRLHSYALNRLSSSLLELSKILEDEEPSMLSLDKIVKNHKELEAILKKIALFISEDKFIQDFRQQIEELLGSNKNSFIECIILNIHNALDSCFSCAADLAQEVRRKNGFVDFFKKLVADVQNDRCETDPSFSLVSSCSVLRTDKWCDKGCVKEPHKNITLEATDKLSYYQYYLRDEIEDDGDVHSLYSENIDSLPPLDAGIAREVDEEDDPDLAISRKSEKITKRVRRRVKRPKMRDKNFSGELSENW